MAELLTAKYDADKLPEGKLRLFSYQTLKIPLVALSSGHIVSVISLFTKLSHALHALSNWLRLIIIMDAS